MSDETTEQYGDYTLVYNKGKYGYIISAHQSYSTMTHGMIQLTEIADFESARVYAHEWIDEVERNTVTTYVNV